MNGPSFPIQDDISMHHTLTIEDTYQMALKVEEKIKRINRGSKMGGTPTSNQGCGGSSFFKGEYLTPSTQVDQVDMLKVPPKGEEDI